MDQPQVDNQTEFAVHPQLLLDIDGEKLLVVVKASFELDDEDNQLELAPEERTRPVRLADIPWGKPEESSIAYPADLFLRKPGTDVLVVGRAYAPEGKAVPCFDAGVSVGSLAKSLRIFGTRVWHVSGDGLSKPTPIDQLDLRYEYAWGGFDDSDPDNVVEEPRNPIGLGKVADLGTLTHQLAPQIEDPLCLISSCRTTAPPPAGLGAIGRHWEPRRRYAGTYDEAWQKGRAPLPPKDFDDRFNIIASPGLHAEKALSGGQKVAIFNLLSAGGTKTFALPKIRLTVEFRVPGRAPAVFTPPLDTVLIDLLETSEEKPPAVELCFRSYIVAPRRMKDTRIVVTEQEVE